MMKIKRNQFNSPDAYGMIELLIVIGLASLIGLGISQFLVRSSSQSAQFSAKTEASKSNKALLDLIKRDFKFNTSFVLAAGGKSLSMTRRKNYQAGKTNEVYQVRYRSECSNTRGGSPQVRKFIEEYYTSGAKSRFAGIATKCIFSMECANGKFPRVVIDVSEIGPRIPSYPLRFFPDILVENKEIGLNNSSIGTGLCVQEIGDKLRVVVESVYPIHALESASDLAIVNSEILISKMQASGLEVLPNQ
ncbi:MAG: hypothetical protein NTX25_04085 [Proteobacteria bacterium]|nr:hypothetical protein [Pseudomonadota bacterium]